MSRYDFLNSHVRPEQIPDGHEADAGAQRTGTLAAVKVQIRHKRIQHCEAPCASGRKPPAGRTLLTEKEV